MKGAKAVKVLKKAIKKIIDISTLIATADITEEERNDIIKMEK